VEARFEHTAAVSPPVLATAVRQNVNAYRSRSGTLLSVNRSVAQPILREALATRAYENAALSFLFGIDNHAHDFYQ
jgi:hypothetical protein